MYRRTCSETFSPAIAGRAARGAWYCVVLGLLCLWPAMAGAQENGSTNSGGAAPPVVAPPVNGASTSGADSATTESSTRVREGDDGSSAADSETDPFGAAPRRKNPIPRSAIPRNPAEVLDAMGPFFIAAFVLASVIALWFGIERLVVLRRGRVIPRAFVERFLQNLEAGHLDSEEALELCQRNGSPVALVFAHGIRKWGKPSVEVEQAIIDGGERQISQMRKHLRVVNGVATVMPLVGLLGTVWGMILAFNQIASNDAMGNANELAVGISLALLTTAAGLCIAIPSLILYMYLAGRVDALVMEMDLLAQNVVHLISAEALADKPVAATRPRRTVGPRSGPGAAGKEAV